MQVTLYTNGKIKMTWLGMDVEDTYDDVQSTTERLTEEGFVLQTTGLPADVIVIANKVSGE
ncbi:MAG: hypothetical protein KKA73_15535 [Chloroflexi bacterium]|nr:hypothetical protein [Chloroflexota bacterium]MBU1749097.1 hypothetical protein [Chloroflexota bacterium]